MANEIILTRSTKSGGIQLPEFKKEDSKSIALEPRRLKISVRNAKNKTTGNVFKKVTGYVKLEVFDDEGNSQGVKVKGISVHFKKKAFTKSANVGSPEELKSGYLYVVAKGLQIPPYYKVTIKKDEDGNEMYNDNDEAILVYPKIWIDNDSVLGLEEFVTSQDALNVDEEANDKKVIDAEYNSETGEVIEDYNQYDENETEEAKI